MLNIAAIQETLGQWKESRQAFKNALQLDTSSQIAELGKKRLEKILDEKDIKYPKE